MALRRYFEFEKRRDYTYMDDTLLFCLAAYRNGYNGIDLKSIVPALIWHGRSNRSAVVQFKTERFPRN